MEDEGFKKGIERELVSRCRMVAKFELCSKFIRVYRLRAQWRATLAENLVAHHDNRPF